MKRSEVFRTDRVPETKKQGLMYIPADVDPRAFTGRRRMEQPKRPAPLPEVVPIYEHELSAHPDSIRVSFEDGSTAVYDIRMDQPHPIIVENINIIRKWKGYNNQPMRRRRKP